MYNKLVHAIMPVVPPTGTDALAAALDEEEEEGTGEGGEPEDTDDDIERTMI